MSSIDIVVVYNNTELLGNLKNSIDAQCNDYNLIALDNTKSAYHSAAEAYNFALRNLCHSEVIVFCHQDIIFNSGTISKILKLCTKQDSVLFGAAGVKTHNGDIISRMYFNIQNYQYKTLAPESIEDVLSLDECLIAANKKVFEKIIFDEKTCDGWHFYVVDLSLQCHILNIPVKVFDCNIVHLSSGSLNTSFYRTEKKIAYKYRKHFKIIRYPWGWCYTNIFLYHLQRLFRYCRYHR